MEIWLFVKVSDISMSRGMTYKFNCGEIHKVEQILDG